MTPQTAPNQRQSFPERRLEVLLLIALVVSLAIVFWARPQGHGDARLLPAEVKMSVDGVIEMSEGSTPTPAR